MSDLPGSYRVENLVGRLVEASVVRLATLADVDLYAADVAGAAGSCKSKSSPVLCARIRSPQVFLSR